MKYIVLLRGINISGKNKIPMSLLKIEMENLGYSNIKTYLNSGNVIFNSASDNKEYIANDIYLMIKEKFGFDIPLFVLTRIELEDVLNNKPIWWGNDNKEIYDNIIFIIPPVKYEEIFNAIGEPKDNLEKIKQYNNCIFWSYDLKNYRQSNWWSKTANTSISRNITIRTANTMKKIFELSK